MGDKKNESIDEESFELSHEAKLEEIKYINWINSLEIEGVLVDRIGENMSDGIIMLKIMDKVHVEIVDWTRVDLKSSNKFKKLSNCNYLFKIFDEVGIPYVSQGGRNIVENEKKKQFTVCWFLLRESFIKENGVKTDDEINDWANQFIYNVMAQIQIDEPDYEPLGIVLYMSDERDIFMNFADDEDIDCPFFPADFDELNLGKVMGEGSQDGKARLIFEGIERNLNGKGKKSLGKKVLEICQEHDWDLLKNDVQSECVSGSESDKQVFKSSNKKIGEFLEFLTTGFPIGNIESGNLRQKPDILNLAISIETSNFKFTRNISIKKNSEGEIVQEKNRNEKMDELKNTMTKKLLIIQQEAEALVAKNNIVSQQAITPIKTYNTFTDLSMNNRNNPLMTPKPNLEASINRNLTNPDMSENCYNSFTNTEKSENMIHSYLNMNMKSTDKPISLFAPSSQEIPPLSRDTPDDISMGWALNKASVNYQSQDIQKEQPRLQPPIPNVQPKRNTKNMNDGNARRMSNVLQETACTSNKSISPMMSKKGPISQNQAISKLKKFNSSINIEYIQSNEDFMQNLKNNKRLSQNEAAILDEFEQIAKYIQSFYPFEFKIKFQNLQIRYYRFELTMKPSSQLCCLKLYRSFKGKFENTRKYALKPMSGKEDVSRLKTNQQKNLIEEKQICLKRLKLFLQKILQKLEIPQNLAELIENFKEANLGKFWPYIDQISEFPQFKDKRGVMLIRRFKKLLNKAIEATAQNHLEKPTTPKIETENLTQDYLPENFNKEKKSILQKFYLQVIEKRLELGHNWSYKNKSSYVKVGVLYQNFRKYYKQNDVNTDLIKGYITSYFQNHRNKNSVADSRFSQKAN